MMLCRLSYKGLGEPLCFLAFGPLATSAFFVAQVTLLPPGSYAGIVNWLVYDKRMIT